jgi:curved DNA-binding protein CbpA
MADLNPYAVFGLKKNEYTINELKARYKKLVLKYHPDKNQDLRKSAMFQTLTFCYDILLNELESSLSNQVLVKTKLPQREDFDNKVNINLDISKGKFSNEKFNQEFDKVKAQRRDEYDDGYGDWTDNSHLERNGGKNAIVNDADPEPFMMGKFADSYELGKGKVGDFSGSINCGFMDYKLAHSTSKLVDETKVNRKDYKNVEEIKKDRANISYVPDAEMARKMQNEKALEEKRELERINKIKETDNVVETIYNKTHKMMLKMFS